MRIAKWALPILLVSPLVSVSARQPRQQTSQPSDRKQEDALAAAARQAREQKKEQPKAAKVWDNDNISTAPGQVNVVGQPPESAAEVGKQAAGASAAKPQKAAGAAAEDKSAIEKDLKAAKEKVQSVKTDLDILQRKYTLDQQSYYGKTDYASDTAGAAALKAEQDEVDAKQQEAAAAQKEVDDLQAKLDAANREQPGASK
jgi:hypothetical protein